MCDKVVVPARKGKAVNLKKGQSIKVINTHGTQVVDTWAFCTHDLTEFMSMEHVRPFLNKGIPEAGDLLVSNRRRPILSFVEDSSPGVHDTFMAACDITRFIGLGITEYHDNCQDNMYSAMSDLGYRAPECPSPFNLWMNTPINNNKAEWLAPVCKAGDYVIFKAEMDCVFVMSACPQDILPINGEDCVPVEAHFQVLD